MVAAKSETDEQTGAAEAILIPLEILQFGDAFVDLAQIVPAVFPPQPPAVENCPD